MTDTPSDRPQYPTQPGPPPGQDPPGGTGGVVFARF